MSEYRTDALTGDTVIIAANRASRPLEYASESPSVFADLCGICPFCVGNEDLTPPIIASYQGMEQATDTSDWQLRIVPNLYPAVEPLRNGTPAKMKPDVLFRSTASDGYHEVVIESPRHVVSVSQLGAEEFHRTFIAYRDRLQFHAENGAKYVQVFKNVGAQAGASIQHTHSQIIALPLVPTRIRRTAGQFLKHSQEDNVANLDDSTKHDDCLMCSLVHAELEAGTRVVSQSENFVAYCPFASRFPFQVLISPKCHAAHFQSTSSTLLGEVAGLLRNVVIRLEELLNFPSYNYMIHTAPFDCCDDRYYHWHIEVFPRLNHLAGFEFGTDYYINPVAPEDAAAQLKK
jgi:UDPglucose--hexose-1-phosphate uridylyltransferase